MRVRQLDAAGDMTFGQGRRSYLENTPEAVAQCAMTRLQLNQGAWFLDTNDGTPYATQILGERTKPLYDAAIRRRILGTPGVRAIAAYTSDVDPDARRLTVSATLETDYGTATVQGAI